MRSSPDSDRGGYGSILKGTLVLDLADEKGSYCSRLLADLGAEVIKIEPPGGDPSRNLGPFYRKEAGGEPVSLSFFYNNLNKKSICLDLRAAEGRRFFKRLAQRADVLVDTFPPGYLDSLKLGSESLRGENPGLIHLSITAFGHSGPKSACRASDSAVSAYGGQTYVCSNGSGKPSKLFGMQSWYAASLFGAVAVMLRLRQRKRTGRGIFIDLSAQEAVVSTLDHVLIDYFSDRRIAHRRDASTRDSRFQVVPCKDGFLLLTILETWDTLIELIDSENGARNFPDPRWRDPDYRLKHFGDMLKVIKEWASRHTKRELFEIGQAMRFPWAPVASAREVLESPQLRSRGFFVESRVSGEKAILPGTPYRFNSWKPTTPVPAPRPGEHRTEVLKKLDTHIKINNLKHEVFDYKYSYLNNNILKGIRVLDLSRMLSGPYATRILADFGAEVIKVQTGKTARGAERDDSAYFSAWNRNKRSIRLDLDSEEAGEVFLKLVAGSDILVENYSPRVMANWGLPPDRMKDANPSLIMLSISAMGQTGPWKDFVGYAPTFHALSGLMSASSSVPGSPATIGHAFGDVMAGLYGAFSLMAALEFRDNTGQGLHIDLSGYEALCSLLGPALMHNSLARDAGERSRWCEEYCDTVPDGCYPCRGTDRWCTLTVKNDTEWRTFCSVLGRPELESDRFATPEGRRKHEQALDDIIKNWTEARSAESAVGAIQKAGLAAGIVQDAREISRDRHLTARKFFISLKHPQLGDTAADRSALWPWDCATDGWRAAPLQGEADRDIFVKLLGMPEETFRDFLRRGVIG
ncbi:MAG: CoA transferase [Acidobacteria bacterium]|nr:CoA transferase [Acidobacteriota bacterium]